MPLPREVLAVKGTEICVNGHMYQQHICGLNQSFLIDVQNLDPMNKRIYVTNQLRHEYAETSADLAQYIEQVNANISILRKTRENSYKVADVPSWRQRFINFFSSFFHN